MTVCSHIGALWCRPKQLLTLALVLSSMATSLLAPFTAAPAQADSPGAVFGALDHGVQWYYPWGQCTWWAATQRPDIGRHMSGNAWWWPNAAEAQGLATGSDPRVGAVATFQPGIQGASWVAGHVGIVKAVATDGIHFLLTEANFGGGPGVIGERWASAGPGVRFIY